MGHRIFITGAAGYVGAMLCDQWEKRPDVECIIGLDREEQPEFLKGRSKIRWITANTADEVWQSILAKENPDVVVHTAWQIREMYRKKELQWQWNVDGSKKVFDFAFSIPSVKKLVHFSTVASYGARADNTIEHLFKEEEGFRKSDYLYAEEKRIVEEHLKEAHEGAWTTGSRVQVAIIRPAAITGPRGRFQRIRFGLQSALSGQLKGSFIYSTISFLVSFVPVTKNWCRQFVHEDDITDAATLFALGELKSDYDAFNLSPPGDVVRGSDMAQAVGKRPVRIAPFLIRIAFFVMWHLTRGKIPTAKGAWKGYSYPIAVDGSKITKMYGFQYRMNSKDAFVKNEGRYARK